MNIVQSMFTSGLKEINTSEGFKAYLHDTFIVMIKELLERQSEIAANYKNNPTVPFDYYGLLVRETDTKIQCKLEVYKRLTDEELIF